MSSTTIYRGADYGMVWDCRPCDAYVGTHRNSKHHAPLGRLANRDLRHWKSLAHAAFDPLWKGSERTMNRKEAYALMADCMELSKDAAHIGKFDVPECMKIVELFGGK